LKHLSTLLEFLMSIFWKEDLGLIFFLKPCERSSITKTSKFFLIKKSTKCEPINPAPPVTIIFAFDTNVLYQHPKLFLFSMHVHRFCKYQYFPFLFLARSDGIEPSLAVLETACRSRGNRTPIRRFGVSWSTINLWTYTHIIPHMGWI
jgi:hypothetical protein